MSVLASLIFLLFIFNVIFMHPGDLSFKCTYFIFTASVVVPTDGHIISACRPTYQLILRNCGHLGDRA